MYLLRKIAVLAIALVSIQQVQAAESSITIGSIDRQDLILKHQGCFELIRDDKSVFHSIVFWSGGLGSQGRQPGLIFGLYCTGIIILSMNLLI